MFKVKITDTNSDYSWETQMPNIPKEGDYIGCYVGDFWCICEVHFVCYEFDKKGEYKLAEINCHFDGKEG